MKSRSLAILPHGGERVWPHIATFAVLSFIAALLAVAAVAGSRLVVDFAERLQGSATVVVHGAGLESPDAAAARATEILAGTKGVARAWMLAPQQADTIVARLIDGDLTEGLLPVKDSAGPPIIAVSFAPGTAIDAASLNLLLRADGLTAAVDDHRIWSSRLWRAAAITAAVVTLAWLALFLAATLVMRLATRRILQVRKDLVGLLHISGASDGYIAGMFRARIGSHAALAAFGGAAVAVIVAAACRYAGAPELAWTDLAAALCWPAIAVAVSVSATTGATRAVLKLTP